MALIVALFGASVSCESTLSYVGRDGAAGDLRADLGRDGAAADAGPGDGLGPEPDTVAPDMAAPDMAAPDMAAPDMAAPDMAAPDTAAPDMAAADLAAPDMLAPDTLAPDTLAPDTLAPDTLAPDTMAPDTLAPDTLAPDTLAPDTMAPDSAPPPDFGGALYTGTFPAKPNLPYGSFRWGDIVVAGVARRVRLYFPGNMASKPPLVIVFHGTGAAGEDAIWGAAANELADAQKVLVAAPNARALTQGDWDNHTAGQIYWETHPNLSSATNNDLQTAQAIIAEAVRAYNADPKRVYLAGFSTGGFFAHFAAFALPNQVSAFASNAGGLVRCATTSGCVFTGTQTSCAGLALQPGWCSCSGVTKPSAVPTSGRKVPGYVMTANNDGVVSPYYSCALASRMQALGYATNLTIRNGGGHGWPPHFLPNAWAFLSSHVLP